MGLEVAGLDSIVTLSCIRMLDSALLDCLSRTSGILWYIFKGPNHIESWLPHISIFLPQLSYSALLLRHLNSQAFIAYGWVQNCCSICSLRTGL